MNFFGHNNNNNIDDYTLIPELIPIITTEKWYEKSYVKIIFGTVLITGISVALWILFKK